MKRFELEHLIRAAGSIAGDAEIVVIGSQAILGQFPSAAGILARSAEADLFPLNRPEQSEQIDGAIGEGSRFHEEFGYYPQGVDEHTAILPRGWRNRLVRIETPTLGAGLDSVWKYTISPSPSTSPDAIKTWNSSPNWRDTE